MNESVHSYLKVYKNVCGGGSGKGGGGAWSGLGQLHLSEGWGVG